MKKNRIIIFILAILLLFLTLSQRSTVNFSGANVFNMTKELTSSKYMGRLAGEKGNQLAEEYIKSYYKSIGLKPVFKNASYLQSFNLFVPIYNGHFQFNIYNKSGKLIKEYKYGYDFKEVTFGNISPGSIRDRSKLKIHDTGSILLVNNDKIEENISTYIKDKELHKQGVAAVIYKTNDTLRFKTPYKLQLPSYNGLVKIMVTPRVYKELCSYSRNQSTFLINSPLQIKDTKADNVVGKLEGSNKDLPPLILSFHFDHVGLDNDGVLYPGALDNATGAAFVLECARILSHYKRERDIIFAGFNGEEEGLVGSRYFVLNPPQSLESASCINFDMVGSKKEVPLTLITSSLMKHPYFNLNNLIKLANMRLDYGENSDHASFNNLGINSVTLINDEVTKIHTPEDNLSNINSNYFNKLFEAIAPFLDSQGISK